MRVKGTVSNDGSSIHGYAVNQDDKTVDGELDSAFSQILGTEIITTCAGRTDRGVHAQGQVISFDVPEGTDLSKLQLSLIHI